MKFFMILSVLDGMSEKTISSSWLFKPTSPYMCFFPWGRVSTQHSILYQFKTRFCSLFCFVFELVPHFCNFLFFLELLHWRNNSSHNGKGERGNSDERSYARQSFSLFYLYIRATDCLTTGLFTGLVGEASQKQEFASAGRQYMPVLPVLCRHVESM